MSWRDHDSATSHWVASSSEPDLKLHLRATGETQAGTPVLFVHGATYASRLYDIPHPGASWLKATADAGFPSYAMDVRGYGKSEVPDLADRTEPYGRGAEVTRDIGDAVDWIRAEHGGTPVALIGGSWGSITTAMFAATAGASDVAALVLYAPIFAERNAGWRAYLADPEAPEVFNPAFKGARAVCENSTRARWDEEIPSGADWRDEAVFQALVQSSLSDDPAAAERDPPAFLAPNGTLLDLWEAFNGRALYDPALITCPTMLIRGGADTTSTRSDALQLFDRLGAKHKRYVEVANGAHFASAERRGPEIFRATTAFLNEWLARPVT